MAISSYYLFQHGQFQMVLVGKIVIDLLIDAFPQIFQDIYHVFIIIYVGSTTMLDTFVDGTQTASEIASWRDK